jgi:hypothetical protein
VLHYSSGVPTIVRLPVRILFVSGYDICYFTYMQNAESPTEVRRWFQAAVRRVWPIAEGSLSLRKTRCIRKNCSACASGKGHVSYVLCGRRGSQRFSIYVPDDLAPAVQQAIENGRHLQELMSEAGVRLVHALKNRRKGRKK